MCLLLYVYQQTHKKKLDDRCKKGIFLGYDKGSPAYLVYFPESQKIMKHRCVRFTEEFPKISTINNKSTSNSDHIVIGDEDFPGDIYSDASVPAIPVDEETEGEIVNVEPVPEVNTEPISEVVTVERAPEEITEDADETVPYDIEVDDFRYPRRVHRPPPHLNEYVSNDQAYNVDFCYGVMDIEVPKSYTEAISSPEFTEWRVAMNEEMESLRENDTFEVC